MRHYHLCRHIVCGLWFSPTKLLLRLIKLMDVCAYVCLFSCVFSCPGGCDCDRPTFLAGILALGILGFGKWNTDYSFACGSFDASRAERLYEPDPGPRAPDHAVDGNRRGGGGGALTSTAAATRLNTSPPTLSGTGRDHRVGEKIGQRSP